MKIELDLFGALREQAPGARVVLDVPEDCSVADLRAALQAHAAANWTGVGAGLLAKSAFASEQAVLRDSDAVPTQGRVAVLPPVSGG